MGLLDRSGELESSVGNLFRDTVALRKITEGAVRSARHFRVVFGFLVKAAAVLLYHFAEAVVNE